MEDQRRSLAGAQNADRMLIKAEHYRARVEGLRTAHHVRDNFLMSEMDTIEIADADDGRAEVGGYVFEFPE